MSDAVINWLVFVFGDIRIVTAVVAFLPLFEVRLSVPIAIKFGLNPLDTAIFSLVGSCVSAVILPLFLFSLLKAMGRLPFLGRISRVVIERAQEKSERFGGSKNEKLSTDKLGKSNYDKKSDEKLGRSECEKKSDRVLKSKKVSKSECEKLGKSECEKLGKSDKLFGVDKRMLFVGVFASLPLPLTGIWTGSLLAKILDLSYFKAFISLFVGNFISLIIILLTTLYFSEYINLIIWGFFLIAFGGVLVLLVRAICKKSA